MNDSKPALLKLELQLSSLKKDMNFAPSSSSVTLHIASLFLNDSALIPVSYTHLTLPTNREV